MKYVKKPSLLAVDAFQLIFKTSRSERFYGFILVITLFAIILAFRDLVIRFHESPFDGVFQTLFPLRRMDAGELPGRDFFYFHGNGIPYLLYPIYWVINAITKQSLLAAMWSSFLVNLAFLYIPIYLYFSNTYGRKWGYAAIVVFSALNEFLFLFGFYNSPLFLGAPMGVRMAPHLFALVVLNWRSKSKEKPQITVPRIVLLGALLGAGPFFAAEQGVYAAVGAGAALIFVGAGWRERLRNIAYFSVTTLAFFLGIQIVAFGNLGTIDAMRIIANNQVWVYGVFPNTFYSSYADIFAVVKTIAIPSQIMTFSATLAIVFLIYTKIKFRLWSGPQFISFFAMYFGGLISWGSNVGYVGQHQSAILLKLLLIVIFSVFITKASKFEGVNP